MREWDEVDRDMHRREVAELRAELKRVEREVSMLREEQAAEDAHGAEGGCDVCEHISVSDLIVSERRAQDDLAALRDAVKEYMHMLGGSVPPYYRGRINSALRGSAGA
jgi:hypothetical protein